MIFPNVCSGFVAIARRRGGTQPRQATLNLLRLQLVSTPRTLKLLAQPPADALVDWELKLLSPLRALSAAQRKSLLSAFPKAMAALPDVVRTMVPIIVPWSLPLAFGISVAIGVLFGLYPARRAALMNPIEALRHVA